MVTQELLSEHQAFIDKARQIRGSITMKPLWTWVLWGATGTASITGYTVSMNSEVPAKLFTISAPTSGVNLLTALDIAGIWSPDVVQIVITEVTTSEVYTAQVGDRDRNWGVNVGDTKMSSIGIADYDEAEVILND